MARSLPDVIPLFPLPNVVHFPRVLLPLHIFEPRYRAMVRDALGGAGVIGMVLLRGEWQEDYLGRPPIFAVGTGGEIVRSEELPDGRFNIVLRGQREFRVLREVGEAPYRQAAVRWREEVAEVVSPAVRQRVADLVSAYVRQRGTTGGEVVTLPSEDELLVNVVAQQLDLPVLERQALLEADGVVARSERLVEVLEFHLETLRLGPVGGTSRPQ